MNKTKQKRANYNTQAVEKTAEYFHYTPRYVRMCIKGDAKGIMPDAVIKKYKEFVSRIKDALEIKPEDVNK